MWIIWLVCQVLRIMSCAARDAGVYVVINLPEIVPCEEENCPSDGALFYNTDVAYDRTGRLIARYGVMLLMTSMLNSTSLTDPMERKIPKHRWLNKWKERKNSPEKWRDLWMKVHKHKHTKILDISAITDVFLDQKRVNECEHAVLLQDCKLKIYFSLI